MPSCSRLDRPAARPSDGSVEVENEATLYYVCVTIITTEFGRVDEVLRRTEVELLPTYRAQPGFVAYAISKTGEGSAVTFGLWQTRQQAERSTLAAEKWMQESASHLIHSLHNHVGELPFLVFTDRLTAYSSAAPAPTAG